MPASEEAPTVSFQSNPHIFVSKLSTFPAKAVFPLHFFRFLPPAGQTLPLSGGKQGKTLPQCAAGTAFAVEILPPIGLIFMEINFLILQFELKTACESGIYTWHGGCLIGCSRSGFNQLSGLNHKLSFYKQEN